MAKASDKKCKNLVYLMLTRYNGDWEGSFPDDMGIDIAVCRRLYDRYHTEVEGEIAEERNGGKGIPTADEIIRQAMVKLKESVSSCDDPSKIVRAIQGLDELKKGDSVSRERKESIFDILNRK